MKKIIEFLTQNNEPVGLKALNLETKPMPKNKTTQNPWEVPIFIRQGEFYKSLKKIEEKYVDNLE